MFRPLPPGGPQDAAVRSRMPKAGTPVTIARSGGPTVAGTIGAINPNSFTVATQLKGQVGATYFVNFQTSRERHRFSARCIEVADGSLVLAYPPKIETVDAAPPAAASGRQSVRLDTAMRCEWRLLKDGRPESPFLRGTLTDISSTGVSLVAEFELKGGAQVEVRVAFGSGESPAMLPAEVKRVSQAEQRGRWVHGLSFQALSHELERSITQFIHRRQAERRHRGLT